MFFCTCSLLLNITSIPVYNAVSCRDHPLSSNNGASAEMLLPSFQGNLHCIKKACQIKKIFISALAAFEEERREYV